MIKKADTGAGCASSLLLGIKAVAQCEAQRDHWIQT